MDAVMIRIKPYKGKYCSRRRANLFMDFFESLQKPDRSELNKEAEEFRQLILSRQRPVTSK